MRILLGESLKIEESSRLENQHLKALIVSHARALIIDVGGK